jgi:hypothetical protein
MQTVTYDLSRWTTQDLLDEVMRRTATDGPALQLLDTIVLRARLAESDRRFGDGVQSELSSTLDRNGVAGTMEMALADGEE